MTIIELFIKRLLSSNISFFRSVTLLSSRFVKQVKFDGSGRQLFLVGVYLSTKYYIHTAFRFLQVNNKPGLYDFEFHIRQFFESNRIPLLYDARFKLLNYFCFKNIKRLIYNVFYKDFILYFDSDIEIEII